MKKEIIFVREVYIRFPVPIISFVFLLSFYCGFSQAQLIPITPDSLQRRLQSADGKIKVVNFWATWCIPCREEFPDLLRFYHTYQTKGVELLFVSTDFPEDTSRCLRFLQKQGVTWPTYWKQGKDEAFINAITANWSGALPFTALYDANGKLTFYHEGKISYQTLQQEVEKILTLKPTH